MNSIIERVNAVCQTVRKLNTNPIKFKKLISNLKREFKEQDLDLTIKTKKDRNLEESHFYVEAFYDAEEDFNNETAIEVFVYHNFRDTVLFEHKQITELLIQIFDAVTHEYRHQLQSRLRNYAVYSDHAMEPYAKYLADPDELDAYSMSIAIELLRSMGVDRAKMYMTRLSVLGKLKRDSGFVSPNLHSYTSHFKSNPILKRLAKKVYKHLESIDKNHIFK